MCSAASFSRPACPEALRLEKQCVCQQADMVIFETNTVD
jgi:hypothetical protein